MKETMVPDRDDAGLVPPPPPVARLDPGELAAALLPALATGAVLARAPVAVVALTGPGAVTCMQGLLTNDVEHPGDGAFVYGALLTPKGMIVVDGWAARLGTTVSYTVPGVGRERALGVFTRSVPPRPARGRVLAAGGVEIARPSEGAPFALQITAPAAQAARIVAALTAAGAVEAGPAVLELARILAGWPALGAEVDDKTIPQEVRYDAIGGVSYTKGCYTGQETVARLHFRGHTNRELRGLLFDAEPPAARAAPAAPPAGWTAVTALDREVGRVTSLAFVPDTGAPGAGTWIGLALLRREVAPGAMVRAAGRDARVVDLPFTLPIARPA